MAGIGFCGLTSWLFQSTLSVRRATLDDFLLRLLVEISIHALRKESDKPFAKKFRWNAISIHALRKESDTFPHDLTPSKRFQSTLSVRRATLQLAGEVRHADISIHDLRKESDTGERRQMAKLLLFQSTLSVRRATISEAHAKRNSDISIHALRKESDL